MEITLMGKVVLEVKENAKLLPSPWRAAAADDGA